jgi:Bacterial DNA-binding protein
MAPRTPKDPKTKSANADKPVPGSKPAKPEKPVLKVVEGDAPAAVGMIKLKDLVDSVTAATGGKKPEVRKTVEATLSAIGAALATGSALAIPPLGKLRVVKNTGPAMTLKLRLADSSKAAGLALADEADDS